MDIQCGESEPIFNQLNQLTILALANREAGSIIAKRDSSLAVSACGVNYISVPMNERSNAR